MAIRKGKKGDKEGGAVYSDSMNPDDGGTVHNVKNKGASDHVHERQSSPTPSKGLKKVRNP